MSGFWEEIAKDNEEAREKQSLASKLAQKVNESVEACMNGGEFLKQSG